MRSVQRNNITTTGFTIVELLIVIVVIAILAAITIVSYNGIIQQATEAGLKSDLRNAATQLGVIQINGGAYPTGSLPATISASGDNSFAYTSDGSSFCLTASSNKSGVASFYTTEDGVIDEGICPVMMQAITSANCPDEPTLVIDARDSRTYWVQELYGGGCWMLTNLAYAGGGDNTYSDTVSLIDGTGGSSTYTVAQYYVSGSANPTSAPTAPSTATDGSGQYGYHYNWCAAMGAQATSACSSSSTPTPTTTASVCPAGWRLPTNVAGDFAALNSAVNGGVTNTDLGLRTDWLVQRAGYWFGSFVNEGTYGRYWTATQSSASNGYNLNFNASYVDPSSNINKRNGLSVRCMAV